MPLAPAAVVGSVVQVDRRLWQSSAGGTITASMSRQLRTSLARRGFGFGAWLASCGPGPDSPAALAPLAPLAWPASPLEPLGPCPLFRTPGSAGVCSAMAGYAGPTGRSQCGLGLRRFLHCIFYQMKEAIDDVIISIDNTIDPGRGGAQDKKLCAHSPPTAATSSIAACRPIELDKPLAQKLRKTPQPWPRHGAD